MKRSRSKSPENFISKECKIEDVKSLESHSKLLKELNNRESLDESNAGFDEISNESVKYNKSSSLEKSDKINKVENDNNKMLKSFAISTPENDVFANYDADIDIDLQSDYVKPELYKIPKDNSEELPINKDEPTEANSENESNQSDNSVANDGKDETKNKPLQTGEQTYKFFDESSQSDEEEGKSYQVDFVYNETKKPEYDALEARRESKRRSRRRKKFPGIKEDFENPLVQKWIARKSQEITKTIIDDTTMKSSLIQTTNPIQHHTIKKQSLVQNNLLHNHHKITFHKQIAASSSSHNHHIATTATTTNVVATTSNTNQQNKQMINILLAAAAGLNNNSNNNSNNNNNDTFNKIPITELSTKSLPSPLKTETNSSIPVTFRQFLPSNQIPSPTTVTLCQLINNPTNDNNHHLSQSKLIKREQFRTPKLPPPISSSSTTTQPPLLSCATSTTDYVNIQTPRYDGLGHYPTIRDDPGNCQWCIETKSFNQTSSSPSYSSAVACMKCGVYLCLERHRNCFLDFHTSINRHHT